MESILLSCRGVVQGVGFRMHVQRIARDMFLTGWVRNEDDGSVSVFAEGEKEKLERLVARLKGLHHAIGPDVKEVNAVEKNSIPKNRFSSFEIAD